jgi:hypothetical protein
MKRLVLTVATVVLLAWVTPVQATPITYMETATATGSLGGLTFTDSFVTITLTADTSTVSGTAGILHPYTNPGSATVNVSGVTGTFTNPMAAVEYEPFLVAGIEDAGSNYVILGTESDALNNYDLRSSVVTTTNPNGIIPGPSFSPNMAFLTTLGNFDLVSVSGNSTFSATLGSATPVPEPASIMLLGTGLLILVGRRFREGRA